jgi:hypothetical protein
MKTIARLWGVVLVFFFLVTACAAAETYGKKITDRKSLTAIGDILYDPSVYEGKEVTIEGKISSECPAGCFFSLTQAGKEASIIVDLNPAGFSIPQRVGRTALVRGTVSIRDDSVVILGNGVEIK